MLAEKSGAFLFELRPDIFPEGYLTRTEIELWSMHYERKEQQLKKT